MAKTTQTDAVAAAYARSMLDLANAKSQAEQIGAELSDLRELLLENRGLASFLQDPAVGSERRLAAIKQIFAGRVHPLVLNLMGVMNDKGRLAALGDVCDAYDNLLDQQLGKVEVDVTVASKLSSEELEDVRRRISAAMKRDAVVHQYVDESIIGGVVIRVQDQLIDGSVRKQLETLRKKMLSSRK